MIRFLIKRFVNDSKNISDTGVRRSYGTLCGVIGIVCNIFLFCIKLAAGTASGSIAIISDAVNNLSDTGSSAVTVAGARLAAKTADREHPYGHGRMEYITALMIAFMIAVVGFELMRSSLERLTSPVPVVVSPVSLVILAVSAAVKLWMFSYNRYVGKLISSPVLEAAAADSLSDVISTSAAAASAIISQLTGLPADGIVGAAVSLMIMKSGYDTARSTVDRLLGTAPDKDTVVKIKQILLSYDDIQGIHDLAVHDYGPGRVMASVHAEVPDNSDLVYIHDVIDSAEERLLGELGISAVIHIDPVPVDDSEVNRIKQIVTDSVLYADESYSLHDFRLRKAGDITRIYFDLAVPYEIPEEKRISDEKKIRELIAEQLGGSEIYITVENEQV